MSAKAGVFSHPLLRVALALSGLGLCVWGVLRIALSQREPPDRCPAGMQSIQARCCGQGQTLQQGVCTGRATSCSSAQDPDEGGQCVARFGVASFLGGELFIGAADWDGASGGERFPRTQVAPFRLDVAEVTLERFRACASCAPRAGEPGQPVTQLTGAEAEAFCNAQHGRLPTAAEWVWAAAGPGARRFAWGNSGLVCRRAAFGLVNGPCADAGLLGGMPELVGSRPDGTSPDGVLDLGGNVAEWTREPSGGYSARGGSFRSTSAAELKSWAALPDREKALYIGFRCAYPP
ncbi:MAG TPA: SUMF1/EgtB/PvdO family nonheme iron enzyme [Polyangiaceae bacterium]|nr:SUMF1/EgtB/PvdO family nonheme iron enzyme [Polyangiaceae bacterium]